MIQMKVEVEKMRKTLKRSSTDRWLTGLLGGIAEYYKIDSFLVRIIFIILSFSGINLPFVLIYFIAALFVPLDSDGKVNRYE